MLEPNIVARVDIGSMQGIVAFIECAICDVVWWI